MALPTGNGDQDRVLNRRALGRLGVGALAASMPGLARAAQQDLLVTPGLLGAVGMHKDLNGRIVAPVFVNDQGPFKFFVDTGANRSALSATLAQKVGAVGEGQAVVHGVAGARVADMVRVRSLRSGAFALQDRVIPILGDDLIASADGMLGADGFDGLRLEFDNRFHTMNVRRSSTGWRDVGAGLTLRAEFKFGQLVSAHGRVGALSLPIVFDTGADLAMANTALRAALSAPARRPTKAGSLLRNAAQPVFVDDTLLIPRIRFQDCVLNNAAAVVGDFHIFELWGLLDQPALIVGMGVLGTLKSFAIDYGRKELQFRP